MNRLWQDGKSDPLQGAARSVRNRVRLLQALPTYGTSKMPKIKTNRAAAKRFRKTASGKIKCGHAFKSHILTKKSTKLKRSLRAPNHLKACDAPGVARMLPYL